MAVFIYRPMEISFADWLNEGIHDNPVDQSFADMKPYEFKWHVEGKYPNRLQNYKKQFWGEPKSKFWWTPKYRQEVLGHIFPQNVPFDPNNVSYNQSPTIEPVEKPRTIQPKPSLSFQSAQNPNEKYSTIQTGDKTFMPNDKFDKIPQNHNFGFNSPLEPNSTGGGRRIIKKKLAV